MRTAKDLENAVCFHVLSRLDVGPTQPPIQWVVGVKKPKLEADNSLPSSAEVKNGGAISPNPYVFMAQSLNN
jgi:hypothetical protein